ncbi:MAG: hypothetical protein ACJ8AW_01505 [Rhodopila sp.]
MTSVVTMPIFALDPATQLNQWFFDGNDLGCSGGMTLAPQPPSFTGTGSISGTTLTLTSITGTVQANQPITGIGISAGTMITSGITGTGGAGTYSINNSQTVASTGIAGSAAAGFKDVHFHNSWMCGPVTLTANGSGNTMYTSNTNWNTVNLSGPWLFFGATDNYWLGVNDTATGHISVTNPYDWTWSPALQFGGASTGITYSTQSGYVTRNANGGFDAYYYIALTSKGTATGTATISGLPLTCSNGPDEQPMRTATNLASLTGAAMAGTTGGSAVINLHQTATTGLAALTDANLTNTSTISGRVSCMQAQ